MEANNLINLINSGFLNFLKIGALILFGIYIVFAFVILRQAKIMTDTLQLGLEFFIRFFALLHFILAIFLFVFAFVTL